MSKEIQIKQENVLEAYKNASDENKKMLESLFGKEIFKPEDIRKRVKTFQDACNILGSEHPFVKQWNLGDNLDADLEAYLKLRVIVAALNEGWTPTFKEDETRYYPWFWLYTQEEINNMNCEDKQKRNLQICKIGAYAGFAYANSSSVPSATNAALGSRLCLKSNELAAYCGTQFIELWMAFTTGAELENNKEE